MKQLFYIFVAALLIGCADGVRKPETVSSTTPYDSIMQAEGYDVLPIFKTRTGHITVSIRVNGRPCVFLVDTGGGATLIDISKERQVPSRTSGLKRLCRRYRLCQSVGQDCGCIRNQRHGD